MEIPTINQRCTRSTNLPYPNLRFGVQSTIFSGIRISLLVIRSVSILLRLTLGLPLLPAISHAQWITEQDPFLRIFYQQVILRDSLNGWAVGTFADGNGGIVRTTDGGDTWNLLYHGGPVVSNVVFVSDLIGFGLSDTRYGGILVRTTDGGASWTDEPSLRLAEPDTHFVLNGLSISTWNDSAALWVSGLKIDQSQGLPPIIRHGLFVSADTGHTWTRLPSLPDSGRYLNDVSFRDLLDGFVISRNSIFRTTDGGQSWFDSGPDTATQTYFFSIQFLSADTGVFAAAFYESSREYFLFGHTTDRGATWIVDSAGQMTGLSQGISEFVFASPLVGFKATWGGGFVYGTTDGGRTWQPAYPGDNFHPLGGVASFDGKTVIAAGVQGKILVSHNGGDAWRDLTPPEAMSYRRVQYLTDVFVAAYGAGNLYFLSVDSGKTWTKYDLPSAFGDPAFAFLDSQKVWMCDDSSRIYHSTTSGRSWTIQKYHDPNDPSSTLDPGLRAIAFVNDSIGCAVGIAGFITRTTNSGSTWSPATADTPGDLLSVSYASPTNVWAVGTDGVILRSNDGGGVWGAVASPVGAILTSVAFTDSLTGYIIGTSGTMLRTTDGGESWAVLTSPPTSASAMRFVTNSLGWVVGTGGAVVRTTDGGDTWEEQESGTTNDLWSVDFRSSRTGIVVGSNSTVLRTSNGGSLTAVARDGSGASNPEAFRLYQNYPNPFNPTTIIRFSSPVTQHLSIRIFDLLGREVSVLVEGEKPAGEHMVVWDASDRPSGVYFAVLETETGQSIVRLLLVR